MIRSIAWLTPWNRQSAVAKFSRYVARELKSRTHDVKIFRTETGSALASANLSDEFPVAQLANTKPKQLLMDFDAIVANIGDEYSFYGALPPVLDVVPALGIFHDVSLENLATSWADAEARGGRGSVWLREELFDAKADLERVTDREVAVRPMLDWLAPKVSGAVVHSHHWADRIRSSCSGDITILPLAMPEGTTSDPSQAPCNAFSSSRYVDGLLPAISEAVRQYPAIELAKRTGYMLGSLGVCRNSAVGQRLADHIWRNFGEGG